jgi:hypothetical protein
MKNLEISIKKGKKTIPLNKYAGKWVAFCNGKVIAHGKTLNRLMEKVKRLKIKKRPSVLLVPKKNECPYI